MKKPKCAAEDYTESDFPSTRKEVFFECYREHFMLLLKTGLLCLIFLIPLIAVLFVKDIYMYSSLAALAEQTEENQKAIIYTANVMYGPFQVIAQTLFAVFFAGVVQLLRQTLWNEPVFFGDDFKRGLKSNSLRFTITVFLLSINNYALDIMPESVVIYILKGVFVAIVLPVAIWFLLYGIYYKLGVFASLKNAVLLYIKTVPATVLLLVLTVVPFWLVTNLITLLIAKYAVIIVLALFYVIPLTMCWMLYAGSIFDKYINKEHYPEVYRKGMRKEEDETQEMRNLY